MTLTPDDVHEVTFPTTPRRKSGYDAREVDEFLDRVEETLRGEGKLTGEEAASVRFTRAHKRDGGYDAHAVDTFLKRVLITLKKRDAAKRSQRQQTVQRLANQVVHHVQQRQAPRAGSASAQTRSESATGVPDHAALQSPQAGQPAYDAGEVDAFLARVEATLRGADTLTSQDVLTTRFPPQPPGGGGYHEASVDAFLVQIAASLRQLSRRGLAKPPPRPAIVTPRKPPLATLTATEVRNVAFANPRRGEPGYEPDEVDDFLDRIEATLRGDEWLTPEDVRVVRFTELPAGSGGYDICEVDAFLSLVGDQLSARLSTVDTSASMAADTWPRIPTVKPPPNFPHNPLPAGAPNHHVL